MDKLTNQFFNSPESFGKGIALLTKYNELQPCDWNTMQSYLEELDEHENDNLNKALKYSSAQLLDTQKIMDENDFLKKTIETLHDKAASNNDNVTELSISIPKEQPPLLSGLVEKYKADCKNRWSARHSGGNERDIFPKLDLFLEAISDKPVNEIKKEDISRYRNLIYKYPVNKNKKAAYKDLSLEEILNREIPDEDRISDETKGNHFTKMRSFIGWCEDNCSFMATDLKKPINNSPKNTTPDDEQRDAFSDEDLKNLFESKQYVRGTHKQPSHFWIPLLGLFTGARENELCQLYKTDIYQDATSGVWVIDINENSPDKKLKKTFHKRIVPIHKKLVDLGFIDFSKSVKTDRLFGDLPHLRDGYGDKFSKWFNDTYRNKTNCNVGQLPDEKKTFHLLYRNNAMDEYSQYNLNNCIKTCWTKINGQE
jgi:integrase